jgi:hypothetical protein
MAKSGNAVGRVMARVASLEGGKYQWDDFVRLMVDYFEDSEGFTSTEEWRARAQAVMGE